MAYVLLGQSELGEVEPDSGFRLIRAADEAIVAVARVNEQGWGECGDVVKSAGFRNKVELGSDQSVIEIVVVGAVPVIGAITDKETLFVSYVLIKTARVVPIFGDLRGGCILIIGKTQRIAWRLLRGGVIRQNCRAYLIESIGGDFVSRKRALLKTASGGDAGGGIVDCVLGATG